MFIGDGVYRYLCVSLLWDIMIHEFYVLLAVLRCWRGSGGKCWGRGGWDRGGRMPHNKGWRPPSSVNNCIDLLSRRPPVASRPSFRSKYRPFCYLDLMEGEGERNCRVSPDRTLRRYRLRRPRQDCCCWFLLLLLLLHNHYLSKASGNKIWNNTVWWYIYLMGKFVLGKQMVNTWAVTNWKKKKSIWSGVDENKKGKEGLITLQQHKDDCWSDIHKAFHRASH